ncbi:MAG: DNA mismatch repair protein MutS [Fimbriimonadaceae bacterium]|nr:DNA mismatch repair protein MutS [Fimbriimonadaceae bacterium]QYK56735.1 MAG: DNA mismatch repair protein MutS [Fimbriimonadaceae bacterium]
MQPRTPMMRQYCEAKAAHPGALVAMRVGDFYEFYGDDAEVAASCLQITLTGREDGPGNRIAMAGVPYHSVEKYLARLVGAGHKVALCDQLEDPRKAKGLVRRGVTRVLSAGTVLEESMLPDRANNFLAAVCVVDGRAGLATLDPSTGEFLVTEVEGDRLGERLLQELARLRPAELLAPAGAEEEERIGELASAGLGLTVTPGEKPDGNRAERTLLKHFDVGNLAGFGIEGKPSAVVAASMVLDYARASGLSLGHVETLSTYSVDGFMQLDPTTRRSLELSQNLSDGSRRHTLLSVLDHTVTGMGSRLLRRWVEQPLLDPEAIRERHESVGRLADHSLTRGDLRDAMKKVSDIERLVARAATGVASPRDLGALRNSLLALPELDEALRKVALAGLYSIRERVGDHRDLAHQLRLALVEDPPPTVRDGGILRPGCDLELDKLRELSRDGKGYIASLEATERAATGIEKLKVGYNSVFGYYLEVPKAHADRVPENYIRKQTTANAERYITAELKDHESAVLGAEEKALALEADLFHRLRQTVANHAAALLGTARAIAELDALASLAEAAVVRAYVRPEIVDEDVLEVEGARHPVVETNGLFVPNDLVVGASRRAMVLTGPNMSGKSTYLRQTALTVLMAQMGSFVPARSCRMGLCDRIFTRVGAKDELALGQSTFMVEMVESANILNNATERSLVVLDEVGRGTATFDGLAIAWAMVEHLAGIGAKTLFATHYHQLNALADQIEGVFNCRVDVEEIGDRVVWTHKVVPGGADKSYGIQVARMAGVPPSVLSRAREVLDQLDESERPVEAMRASTKSVQLTLFEAGQPEIVKALVELDVTKLTPVEALLKLDEWKRRFGKA